MALSVPAGSDPYARSLYPQGVGAFGEWGEQVFQETTAQRWARHKQREQRVGRIPGGGEQTGKEAQAPQAAQQKQTEAQFQMGNVAGRPYQDPTRSTAPKPAPPGRPSESFTSGVGDRSLKQDVTKTTRYRAVTNNYIRTFQNELEKLGEGGEAEAREKAAKQVAKMLGDDADLFEEILTSDPQSMERKPFYSSQTQLFEPPRNRRLTPEVQRKIDNMVHAQQMGEKLHRFMGSKGVLGERLRGLASSGVPIGQGDQGFDAAAMDLLREQAGGPAYGGGYPPSPQPRRSIQGGVVGPGPRAPAQAPAPARAPAQAPVTPPATAPAPPPVPTQAPEVQRPVTPPYGGAYPFGDPRGRRSPLDVLTEDVADPVTDYIRNLPFGVDVFADLDKPMDRQTRDILAEKKFLKSLKGDDDDTLKKLLRALRYLYPGGALDVADPVTDYIRNLPFGVDVFADMGGSR